MKNAISFVLFTSFSLICSCASQPKLKKAVDYPRPIPLETVGEYRDRLLKSGFKVGGTNHNAEAEATGCYRSDETIIFPKTNIEGVLPVSLQLLKLEDYLQVITTKGVPGKSSREKCDQIREDQPCYKSTVTMNRDPQGRCVSIKVSRETPSDLTSFEQEITINWDTNGEISEIQTDRGGGDASSSGVIKTENDSVVVNYEGLGC